MCSKPNIFLHLLETLCIFVLDGFVDPSLDHVALSLREFQINLPDLEEYVQNVDFNLPSMPIPKYPILKENHLNFLKPGSKEVVTRPVHIHEHLPPMFTIQEGTYIFMNKLNY